MKRRAPRDKTTSRRSSPKRSSPTPDPRTAISDLIHRASSSRLILESDLARLERTPHATTDRLLLEGLSALSGAACASLEGNPGAKTHFAETLHLLAAQAGAPRSQEVSGLLPLVLLLDAPDTALPLSADDDQRLRAGMRILESASRLDAENADAALTVTRSALIAIRRGLDRARDLATALPKPDPIGPDFGGPLPGFAFDDLPGVLLELYGAWIAGTAVDPNVTWIGAVTPNCVRNDELFQSSSKKGVLFRAHPAAGRNFGAARPASVRLLLGNVDLTPLIELWSPGEIRFRVPASAPGGVVMLLGPSLTIPASPAAGAILSKLDPIIRKLPSASPYPRVTISIASAPRITSLRFNGAAVRSDPVILEACDAFELAWIVETDDHSAFSRCASAIVELRVNGVTFASGLPLSGRRTLRLDENLSSATVRLSAVVNANGSVVGADERSFEVEVERHLQLTSRIPRSSGATPIEVTLFSEFAWLEIRLPCPATKPVAVKVTSSDDDVARPHRVDPIPVGQAVEVFRVKLESIGHTVIKVEAPGYQSAELTLVVVESRTAVVLSGGGAKGSFEAGALAYLLRHEWTRLNVRAITSTSVGSINAIGLAENQGLPTAEKIERTWLGLRRSSNMWEVAPWVPAPLVDLLTGSSSSGGGPNRVALGIVTLGISEFVRAFWLSATIDSLSDALESDDPPRFVFDLAPTRRLLATVIDVKKIAAGGLELRMCAVALEDGETYYVTERGHLVRNAIGSQYDQPIVPPPEPPDPLAATLIAGAMASAGIPAFFPPEVISTADGRSRTFVDGGVREVLPVNAALDLGAKVIVAISAGRPDPHPWPSPELKRPPNIAEIAFRGLDLHGNEVARNDPLSACLACRTDVDYISIQPRTEVHDIREIDPGKIRINMAYGYMTAFDTFLARKRAERDAVHRQTLIDPCPNEQPSTSTESIRELREEILRLEQQALARVQTILVRVLPLFTEELRAIVLGVPPRTLFVASDLSMLRAKKHELERMLEARWRCFGAESLPKVFGHLGAGESSVIRSWWEGWETALGTANGLGLGGAPFDRLSILSFEPPSLDLKTFQDAVSAWARAINTGSIPAPFVTEVTLPRRPAVDPAFNAEMQT